MPCIILEGPDGSGKSHTAAEVSAAVSLPIYHAGGPPKDGWELIKRVKHMLSLDNQVFDRFSLISEMVYGPIVRDTYIYDSSWLTRLTPEKYIIVYCRPSTELILNTQLKAKPHKDGQHVEAVVRQRKAIIDAYDGIMKLLNPVVFNREISTVEELCAELILRLDNLRSNA